MVPVACDEENRSRVAFCGDMKRKSEQIRVSTGRVRRVELQFEYLLSALFEYTQRCRQRYLVFDRYLYRLQSQTLYLYLDRSCLRFFFCFSFLFLFLAKLLYPSPSDWQFSSIAISAISISLPPPARLWSQLIVYNYALMSASGQEHELRSENSCMKCCMHSPS